MSILDKQYVVTMDDGSEWAVPMRLIAENRAKYYAEHEYNGDLQESLKDDTLPYFTQSAYAIHDWASNNMNWHEVQPHAVMIKAPDVDFQDGWVNGAYSIREHSNVSNVSSVITSH